MAQGSVMQAVQMQAQVNSCRDKASQLSLSGRAQHLAEQIVRPKQGHLSRQG